MKFQRFVLFCSLTLLLVVSACGASRGGLGSKLSEVVGRALAPAPAANQTEEVALGDTPVVLVEFVDPCDETPCEVKAVHVGTTDAEGYFHADVETQYVVALVVGDLPPGTTPKAGDGAISGLLNPDQPTIDKDLDVVTSVACRGGTTAVVDGSSTAEQLDAQRVQNLEDAAAEDIPANPGFDFYDADQVSAAVQAVRVATNDGERPAPSGAFN